MTTVRTSKMELLLADEFSWGSGTHISIAKWTLRCSLQSEAAAFIDCEIAPLPAVIVPETLPVILVVRPMGLLMTVGHWLELAAMGRVR